MDLLQPLPDDPALLHLRVAPAMGALADSLGRKPDLYRGLRAEALAPAPLPRRPRARLQRRAGADREHDVLDDAYRQKLPPGDPNAGTGYALETTGWAFDIRRDYSAPAQAAAFQYELERLQARNLIAWSRTPHTIHVTVSAAAASLVPVLLRRAPAGAPLGVLRGDAGLERLHVLGRERVAGDPQVAAGDLLQRDPGDRSHVLALDLDHGVGEALDDLALLLR